MGDTFPFDGRVANGSPRDHLRYRLISPDHPAFVCNWFAATVDPAEVEWDNPTMVITLDAKRRLTVPRTLAPASPGDHFDARFDAEEDVLVFRRLPARENWFAVLKACPVSMDDVPPRRRGTARRRKL